MVRRLTRRCLELSLLVGLMCASAYAQSIPLRLNADVERPAKSAVIFLVDGMDLTRLGAMVQAGELPNIQKRFVEGGTQVRDTITGMPSVTYANCTSAITGDFPGHHGIVANFWLDRQNLTTHYYMTYESYLTSNQDFVVPTIFDLLADRFTVSIQAHTHRGVSETITNRDAFGFYYFFRDYIGLDRYAGEQFKQVGPLANRVKRWPTVILNYYPGTDDTAHAFGADSPEFGRALRDVDRTIGRITTAIDNAGLGDSTYYVLMADHSHVPISPGRDFDFFRWLCEARGLRVRNTVLTGATYASRLETLNRYDAFGGADEDRTVMFHLRGRNGWNHRPGPQEVESWLLAQPSIVDLPAVQFALIRGPAGGARVFSREGSALVERRIQAGRKEYRLMAERGDPLHYREDPALAAFVDAGWHGSREWLVASKDSLYPDFVPQVVEMFDSPHTGEVVFMAADEWSFCPKQRGGHGSWTRRDIRIPLFYAGPDVPRGGKVGPGRQVDVVPTVLGLIGEQRRLEGVRLDGINLADTVRAASTTPPPEAR